MMRFKSNTQMNLELIIFSNKKSCFSRNSFAFYFVNRTDILRSTARASSEASAGMVAC